MKDPRRSKYGIYFRQLADLMDLKDWALQIHDSPPDNSRHAACVYIPFGRRYCNLYLSDPFLDHSPEGQRQTLVHELTHCHFEPMRDLIHQLLSDKEFATFELVFELGLDSVATAWARTLPLRESDDAKEKEPKKEEQVRPLLEEHSLAEIGSEDSPEMYGYL